MLVTLIIVIVITQSYMGMMRKTQRVSMVVNSVTVRLAQLVEQVTVCRQCLARK
jgi:hypothetical protein